eukprot:4968401-Lingulodinium_polyedra.AAC.1
MGCGAGNSLYQVEYRAARGQGLGDRQARSGLRPLHAQGAPSLPGGGRLRSHRESVVQRALGVEASSARAQEV